MNGERVVKILGILSMGTLALLAPFPANLILFFGALTIPYIIKIKWR